MASVSFNSVRTLFLAAIVSLSFTAVSQSAHAADAAPILTVYENSGPFIAGSTAWVACGFSMGTNPITLYGMDIDGVTIDSSPGFKDIPGWASSFSFQVPKGKLRDFSITFWAEDMFGLRSEVTQIRRTSRK